MHPNEPHNVAYPTQSGTGSAPDAYADALNAINQRLARVEAMLYGGDRGVPVTAAANRLGVHRNTVLNWIRRGECPARKWGGDWEIDPQWIAAQMVLRGATPAPLLEDAAR